MTINYKELSELTDKTQVECRNVFKEYLSLKKVGMDSLVPVTDLEKYFKPVNSVDDRYDKMPFIAFCIQMKKLNYRQYLTDKKIIKALGFSEGLKIYDKIMTPEQKQDMQAALKHNHIHLYGIDSYENTINKL